MEKEENMWKPKILGIFNEEESQSVLSREIEMLEVKNNIDNGMDLATRTYRVYEYIINTIKENGDMSQFKEDVLYIIHGLLQKQLSTKELTVTQIVVENRDKEMQLERERYMKNKINKLEQKEFILDKVTEFIKDDVTTEDIKFEGSKLFHFIYKKLINITKEKIVDCINSYKDEIEDIILEGEKNNGK